MHDRFPLLRLPVKSRILVSGRHISLQDRFRRLPGRRLRTGNYLSYSTLFFDFQNFAICITLNFQEAGDFEALSGNRRLSGSGLRHRFCGFFIFGHRPAAAAGNAAATLKWRSF
jgi:hypothetical protein